ncbi:agamous-like MADS-box protein AGL80 [Henckelia pumila]|uniref:agamous-like MADS-box protein AGL80 n=1 Tax=Henckelia pumila TaxID=405737 RepID=UPI003C6E98D5
MPRKRTKFAKISDENERASTFKKRVDSLFKKASELSILCGVYICIIILNPSDGTLITWSSEDEVQQGFSKFLRFPEEERLKKMVLRENFLKRRVDEEAKSLMKLRKENEEKEMEILMDQTMNGASIDELDENQLNGLLLLADDKIKMLENRKDDLEKQQGQLFIEGERNGFVMETDPKPTEATHSFMENEIELPDDLNQVWPSIYFP